MTSTTKNKKRKKGCLKSKMVFFQFWVPVKLSSDFYCFFFFHSFFLCFFSLFSPLQVRRKSWHPNNNKKKFSDENDHDRHSLVLEKLSCIVMIVFVRFAIGKLLFRLFILHYACIYFLSLT